MRALVLSAGLGLRLRPLTDEAPKPLLPVAGRPILEHTLRSLAAAGCEAVAVNLHHRGEQIRRHFGDRYAGMPITWSEEPRLLGTLGALEPLRGFFAGAGSALLVNGDSLCDWPLAALLRRHQASGAAATLLVAARPDPAGFGGGIALGRGGTVLALRPRPAAGGAAVRQRVFAGAHVLSAELLAGIAAGFADTTDGTSGTKAALIGFAAGCAGDAAGSARTAPGSAGPAAVAEPLPGRFALPSDIVRDLYEPLLAVRPGSLASLTTSRRWHDLGTPRRFLAATLDWATGGSRGRWISPAAEVSGQAVVVRSSIEAGCRVEAGAHVEGSVLLPGAVVRRGATVRDSILGPGAEAAAGSRVFAQVATRQAIQALES